MEILQKVIVTILQSQQLRDALVYTTLLFVFAIAWVSYRWPDLAGPAILFASVVLGGEAVLIYFSIKRLRNRQE